MKILDEILEKTVKEKTALIRNTIADSILEQIAEHLNDHTEEEIWKICEDLVNKIEIKINSHQYQVFGGECYHPVGGIEDFLGYADTIEEGFKLFEKRGKGYGWDDGRLHFGWLHFVRDDKIERKFDAKASMDMEFSFKEDFE